MTSYSQEDVERLVAAVAALSKNVARLNPDEFSVPDVLVHDAEKALALFRPRKVGVREAARAVLRSTAPENLMALRLALADEPKWDRKLYELAHDVEHGNDPRPAADEARRLLAEWGGQGE